MIVEQKKKKKKKKRTSFYARAQTTGTINTKTKFNISLVEFTDKTKLYQNHAMMMMMMIWCFTYLTKSFKTYRDDEGVIMKRNEVP